jgi:hypothetical protein
MNEMIVSGEFNAGTVLKELFSASIARYVEYVKQMRELLRNVGVQVKSKGMKNLGYLFKLIKDTKELSAELYETKQQISEIALGLAPVKGVKETESFKQLYSSAHLLSALASELSDDISSYEANLMLAMWKNLNKTKIAATGLSIFAIAIGAAALFYAFFGDTFLFGFPTLQITIGLLVVGIVSAMAAMGAGLIRFKL